MLFNSFIFMFAFLPAVLAGFYLLRAKMGMRAAFAFLALGSLFFYAYWNPVYIVLILGSIIFNYACGRLILRRPGDRLVLGAGIAANLGLLGIFKYTDFVIQTLNDVSGAHLPLQHIVLPLAISFFTFQQIAFLLDTYRGRVREESFLDYTLFVSFFPQLIAGPIVHHRDMMPQFKSEPEDRARLFAMGLSLFAVGLFKKAVLADSSAVMANNVFGAANGGASLSMADAWGGALAYSFQIYFDFSGYSDMAIGLALLFGIKLPVNFYAPYKATDIAEFWRRWHITLSRFLRDNLYIPLGGNRAGRTRQGVNIMVTMLLGGLWHGASWTFVLWGGLHGVFIVLSHFIKRMGRGTVFAHTALRPVYIVLTFMIVTLLWVFFRAESLEAAWTMLQAMTGLSGKTAPALLEDRKGWALLGALLVIIWTLPNSMKFFGLDRGDEDIESLDRGSVLACVLKPLRLERFAQWSPHLVHMLLGAALLFAGMLFMQSNLGEEFIYFDF